MFPNYKLDYGDLLESLYLSESDVKSLLDYILKENLDEYSETINSESRQTDELEDDDTESEIYRNKDNSVSL